MTGFRNHHCISAAALVGRGRAIGRFAMKSLRAFPGVFDCATGSGVPGEVYEVDDATLQQLDRLEGEGHFYQRRRVRVRIAGRRLTAWMYVLLEPDHYQGECVARNDWRASVHGLRITANRFRSLKGARR
jgi:gamma-glutamylcyclotransferase (GGCT)/AIG2-like uncharacterized protein YtfP